MDRAEIAASMLQPHFDAVRDTFVAFRPVSGHEGLVRLKKTRFIVDEKAHNTRRHFAFCRDDGMLITLAPQLVDEPVETVVAVISHEFGHAGDFAYPACWIPGSRNRTPAVWIGDGDTKEMRRWRTVWSQRNADQVEWAADEIAWAVIGKRIEYCGDCLVQCFSGGIPRPTGLR